MPTTTTKKPRGGKAKRSRKDPPTDASAVVKKKKKPEVPDKKEFYCLEKDGKRMVAMTEDKVSECLATGWMLHHTYDNVREALAWNKMPAASAQVESAEESAEEASSEDEEQEEEEEAGDDDEEDDDDDGNDGGGEDGDDEEAEIPSGSPEKTKTHKELCTRNGLYYKTYEEVRKVKKHFNGQKFKTLGLDKATTDMKQAAVVTPKRKKTQPKKKKAAPAEVRRSTRTPTTVPVYKEPKNEEEDPEEEEEHKEEASDYEEGRDDEEEDAEEGEDMASEEEDLVSMARKLGEQWGERFGQLMEYKKEHGNCKVSRYRNKTLGLWVRNQRTNYKAWKKGKKSGKMTQEKVDLLESIGFQWSIQAPHVPWMTRFDELKDYKDMIGNCNYPLQDHYSKCTPLGKWVNWQRFYYQTLKTGQKFKNNGLTKERVALLKGIGFDFDGPVANHRK